MVYDPFFKDFSALFYDKEWGKKDLEFSETLSEFSFHKRGFFRFKLENRPIASALLTLAPVTLTFPPF